MFSQKIRIKELIQQKRQKIAVHDELSKHITVEVQHVQQEEIVHQQEQVVEVMVDAQIQEIQRHEGVVIDFQTFQSEYKDFVKQNENITHELYQTLKNELFANLPHAIKFLTPKAAKIIAANLPNLVALNKDNLPDGFFLKQTATGEWVLDYSEYLENEHANVYTPEVNI